MNEHTYSMISYDNYEHSYAYVLKDKLKTLNFYANVKKMPVNYVRKVVLNLLKLPSVYFTDKEQEFYHDICECETAQQVYYRAKNAVNKAKEIMVRVDETGMLCSVM